MPEFIKIKGFGLPPRPRRPIGLRGGHQHGRPLNDPVYPTSKIPLMYVPRFPSDWRNTGRRLLTMGLAKLEDKKLNTYRQSLDWQNGGECESFCANACSKSQWRCLCSWRVKNTSIEHLVRMDGMLREYKGVVNMTKPLFTTLKQVAKKNRYHSEPMVWDAKLNRYVFISRENINEAYNLMPNRKDDHYETNDPGYNSESDPDYSDDELTDSDEEGEITPVSQRNIIKKI